MTASARFRIAELPSRARGAVCPAAERIDPYWDGMWDLGSSVQWFSAERVRRQRRAGVMRASSSLPTDEKAAVTRLRPGGPRWQAVLDTIGALDSWRTLGAQQLAHLIRQKYILDPRGRSPLLRDLFAAGILEMGTSVPGLVASKVDRRLTLFRLARTTSFDRYIEPYLTCEEWVSVTGGRRVLAERQYDRHNVLASEVLLRAAEFVPVSGVAGEKLASQADLAYAIRGLSAPDAAYGRAADGVLLRPDGVRIAIEVTATTGGSFEKKVASWARVLHEARYDDTGLVVVLLVAPASHLTHGRSKTHLAHARQAITRITAHTRGIPADPTSGRIFVADWEDWFPASGVVSRDFLTLRVDRTPGPRGDRWPQIDLANPKQLPAPAAPRLRGFEPRLAALRQTPAYLARGIQLAAIRPPALGPGKGVTTGKIRPPARLVPPARG